MRDSDLGAFTDMLGDIASLYGKNLTTTQIAMWFRVMAEYSVQQVQAAFDAHARDAARGRFMPVPADLLAQLERIASNDGRPTPEEAWSTAVQTHNDEQSTVVWTQETATAWADVGQALMDAGDRFNAGRGFIAKYTDLVAAARRNGIPVQWLVCQGWDKELRHQAIQQAVEAGRITREYAAKIHPRHNLDAGPIVAAIAGKTVNMLNDKSATTTQQHLDRVDELQRSQSRISELLSGLRAGLEADGKNPMPTREQNTRIVNEAIEAGVLRTVSEIDHWMTKANERDDLSVLQVLILNRRSEARRHG